MTSTKPLLKDFLPDLVEELTNLLIKDNNHKLAEKVNTLEIYEKCNCNERSCASFYTAPKPNGSFGEGHQNLVLKAEFGMFILDVVNDEIMFIEILDRPNYKKILDRIEL
jgi:hypothetical protein